MPQASTLPRLDPRLRRTSSPARGERVELSGHWILRALEERMAELTVQLAEHARDAGRHWDLSGLPRAK